MPKDSIDSSLPTPLYYQVYTILRQKILSGDYVEGDLLPSESEITRVFQVSRITAKRALDELATEGIATRRRGRGTLVTYSEPITPSTDNFDGLMENLLQIAQQTEVDLISFEYEPANKRVARALALTPGQTVQHAVRVRHKDGKPFSYVVTWVPEDIGRSFDQGELENQAILALLERAGVTISHARQTISATLADNVTAPLLGISLGWPLLKVDRTVYDKSERPVELINVYYRPDLYQISLNLSRVTGTEGNFWQARTDQAVPADPSPRRKPAV